MGRVLRLRRVLYHLRAADGQRSDLHLAGLLLDTAFFARHQRIRRRLLGAAA